MHWSGATLADSPTMAPVWQFIQEGGNFLGQCAGEDTYENYMQSPRHFHTTAGTTGDANQLALNYYTNPDMAFSQFQGIVAPRSGQVPNWVLKNTSSFDTETYNVVYSNTGDTIVASARHYGAATEAGGNVFYIGGHDYMTSTATQTAVDSIGDLHYINGTRMFLNACLIPANRPTSFALNPGSNATICSGDSVTLGGSPTGPAGSTYSWSPSTGLSNPTSANPHASPSVTTSYTVIAFDGSCQGGPDVVTVTVHTTPTKPSPGSNTPICANASLNLTTATVAGATYAWTGPNGFTSALQNPTISNATTAAAGVYSLTVTVSGCTSPVGTTTVVVNTTPATPVPTSNSPICVGSTLNLLESVVGVTYNWTGPNSFSSALQNPTISGATTLATGTYSLTLTSGGCTSPVGTISATVNPIPATPSPTNSGPICAGNTLTLTAGVSGASYNWTGPNVFSSTLQNPAIASASAACTGTYSLTVTVAGCASAVGTTLATVNAIPATPAPTSNSPVCEGTTLNLMTSPVAGATYSWTGPNGFTSALQNPFINTVTPAAAGIYSLTISVSGCSSSTGTVNVVINPTPATPAPTNNGPICAGSTLDLMTSAVGGATYNWTGPNSFSSSSQNPFITSATTLATGVYSLTVTVTGCASAVGTTSATVSSIPATPAPTSNSPICVGSTLNLMTSAVAGATYSWTGPNGFSSALQNPFISSATTAATGTYSVTVTVGGCASAAGTTSATVSSPPAAPTPSSNTPVCIGFPLNLTTPVVAGATYNWTGPNSFSSSVRNPSIPSATAADAGTYSVTVTVGGCTGAAGTTSVVVNPIPATPAPTNDGPICAGSTLTLASGVSGATYNWTGPNTFSSSLQNPAIVGASVAATGTYSLTVTELGCTSLVGTTNATVNAIPTTPSPGSNSPVCEGSTLTFNTALVAGATYSWAGPNGFTSGLQNPNIPGVTAAAAGTYSLTITVNGCTSSAGTVDVVINPTPATPAPTSNSPICANTTLNLSTAPVGSATYSWTGPNSFSSALQSPSVTNATTAATGTYSLTVTVGGCASAAGTTLVTVNPTPATPSPTNNGPICQGSTLNLMTSPVGGATYSWTGPNSFSSSSQNPFITNATTAATGSYSLTVTVSGCPSSPGTTVATVNGIPGTPTPSSNSPVCVGFPLNLSTAAVAGATYSWTGPNGFISALQNPSIASATAAAAGTYSVSVTVSGCGGASGSTTVVVNPTPATPVPSSNSPICAGSTLNLNTAPVGGATYSWTGPNVFSSSLQSPSIIGASVASTGTYSLTVTVLGCTSLVGTTSATVNAIPATPSPTSNSPVCEGSTLTFGTGAVAGATYSWTGPNGFSSSLQNPSIASVTAAAAGTYSITVTVGGCNSSTATINATVSPVPATPTPSSNTPICANTALNLSTSAVGNATYSWTGPNSFSSSLQNPTIASATIAAAGTYSLVVNVLGCNSAAGTTSVVVNPSPATPAPTNNGPICEGSTLNLLESVSGATYSWTGPNGFTSALQNPSIIGATTLATGTYSLTVTVAGCPSLPGTTVATVNGIPGAPSPSSNTPVCVGFPLNLSTAAVAGATYSWTGPNGFSSPLQNPTIASVTSLAGGTYSVTVTVAGCGGASGNTTVVVNPTPATPSPTNNGPICDGSTLTLNNAPVGGATYSWTGPNSFSSALLNPSIVGATTLATGTYSLTVTVLGCTSLPGTTAATVNPIPATPSPSSNTPVCLGSSLNLSTTPVGSATYSWTGPNTFSSSLQNPSIGSVTSAAAGTYSLTVTVSGCTSGTGTTPVTITPLPATPSPTSNTPVCAGSTLNLMVAPVAGATYSWTGPNSFSSALQNPFINNVTAAAAGTYSLTVIGAGCASVAGTTSVTINPTPATPAPTNNGPICAGSTLNLFLGAVGGATYNWTGPNTFSSSSQNPFIPGATSADGGTYSVTVTVLACPSLPGTTTAVVDVPAIVNAGFNQTVCANKDSVQLSGTSSTLAGVWSTSGSGSFSPNTTTLNAIYIPSNADTLAGSVTLTLTSSNNGACAPVTDNITITITHAPTANAGPNQTVCANNDAVSLNGSFTVASGGRWTTTGTGTFAPNNTTMNATYIPSNADTTAGHVSIILKTTGNGLCKQVTDTMKVTITHAPKVNAGRDTNVCLNNMNCQLNGHSSTTTGVWTTLGSGTFTPNSSTLNATYDPSTADTIAKTVKLVLTSTGNGTCNPVTDTIKITYSDVPIVNAGSNQTVCANNADVSLHATSSTSTGQWTTSGTGTFNPNNADLNATYIPSAADTAAHGVTLTFTSTNGCAIVSRSITITITPAPYVNAGPDQFVCKNNTLEVSLHGQVGAGASAGQWSTSGSGIFIPNSTTLNANYNPSSADTAAGLVTLVLTSTGNGNCLAVTDTMHLTYTRPPLANAGTNLSGCANNSIPLDGIITGGIGTGIWTTSNGSGTFVPNNTTLNCSYIPSNADTLVGSVVLVLSSTNNGGCLVSKDSITVNVIPGPIVNAGPNKVLCKNNANVSLSGSITHASGGIWTTTGSGIFSPNNTSLATTYISSSADTAAGSVKLALKSTGNGLCNPVIDTVKVTFTPAPDVNAGAPIYICTGSTSASLNGIISGGSTHGKWTTSGSGTFSPNDSALNGTYNLSNADTTAKQVELTLTSTDNGGCLAEKDTVWIRITPIPVVNAGRDTTVCANNANVVLNGSVIGGSGTGVWKTLGSGTFTPKDSLLNATYNPSNADTAAHKVSLVLTATNACLPVSDTVVLKFTPAPIVNHGGNQVICAGQVVDLNASITVSSGGIWTSTGNGIFTPSASSLNTTYIPGSADTAAGNATLYLTTTGNGTCRAIKDSVLVTIQSKPQANFKSGPLCVNTNIGFTDLSTVSRGSISTWWWNFRNDTLTTQDPTNKYTTTGPQTVTLAVSTSAGCTDTITKDIFVSPLPVALYTYNRYCSDSAQFSDLSTLALGNIGTWAWKFGDSTKSALENPGHTYLLPGIYKVSLLVISDSGCTSLYTDTVNVHDCVKIPNQPAVPSAFTPNGDGNNDVLYVLGGPFAQMDFRVFDEWGTQLFRSTVQSDGWDGRYGGKLQPESCYKWTLVGVTISGESIKMTGNVTILR